MAFSVIVVRQKMRFFHAAGRSWIDDEKKVEQLSRRPCPSISLSVGLY